MHEIIHIVDAESFADAPPRDLEVEAVDHRLLTAGYYFVLGSRKGTAKKRGKRYLGPLPSASHARLLMTSALLFGLVDDDAQLHAAIAECRSTVRHATAANDARAAGQPAVQAVG